MTTGENQDTTSNKASIVELLAMASAEDIEIEIPTLRDLAQPADLS